MTESYVSVVYYRPLLNGLFYVLRVKYQLKQCLLVHIQTETPATNEN